MVRKTLVLDPTELDDGACHFHSALTQLRGLSIGR
jgi:hypothetical protein